MIIFYDGSNTMLKGGEKNKRRIVAWGLHAIHGDEMIERHGSHYASLEMAGGDHEFVALFESVKLAVERGVAPADVAFYTDDEVAAYGSYQLGGPPHMAFNYTETLVNKVKCVGKRHFTANQVDDVLQYLLHGRFYKVKGHKNIINNVRVDYLARFARNLAVGKSVSFMEYDRWLGQKFTFWKKGVQIEYVPPFCVEQL